MKRRTLITAVLSLMLSPAFAHDIKGPHGGRVADAGRLHVELVAKGNIVDLYLADSANKAVPAADYKAVAILLIAGKSQRVVLEPAGGNRLTGSASAPLRGTLKGAVQLTAPDGKTSQAKFD